LAGHDITNIARIEKESGMRVVELLLRWSLSVEGVDRWVLGAESPEQIAALLERFLIGIHRQYANMRSITHKHGIRRPRRRFARLVSPINRMSKSPILAPERVAKY
jgi:hypothetical protein